MFLKYAQEKRMCLQCIDYMSQLIFYQHAPLNLSGNDYVMAKEIMFNKIMKLRDYQDR